MARFILNDGKNDEGVQILTAESIEEMRKGHAVFDEKHGDLYGLTMLLRKYEDGYLYGHHGSAPPYSLAFFAAPQSGYGAAVMMNTWRPEARFEICDMIFDHLNRLSC